MEAGGSRFMVGAVKKAEEKTTIGSVIVTPAIGRFP